MGILCPFVESPGQPGCVGISSTAPATAFYCSISVPRSSSFPPSIKHSTWHPVGAQCTFMVLKLSPSVCGDLQKDHKSSPIGRFVVVGILCSGFPCCNRLIFVYFQPADFHKGSESTYSLCVFVMAGLYPAGWLLSQLCPMYNVNV